MNPDEPRWLRAAYALSECGKVDAAMDVLFREFDELHEAGNFARSNRVLELVNVDRLGLELAVSVLTITRCAKTRLPSRQALYERVKRVAYATQPKRAERLVVGLE